jgi:cytochrome c biogenesis protein CcdA
MNSAFQAPALSFPIITGFALIDSINPCVIGVLILLLTVLLKAGKKRAVLINGISYTVGVYVTYLVGGLTLLGIFNGIRAISFISQILYIVIGAFVLFAGFLEVKDYFWYGRWFSLGIPPGLVKYVEKKAAGAHVSLIATFSFGALLTLIELPCTGAPYLAILTLMSQSGFDYLTSLPLLLYYNVIFVLPLLVIIFMAYKGFGLKRMEGWRQEHRGTMRLYIGLALLAIGIWIVTQVALHSLWPLVIATAGIIGIMWFTSRVLHL